MIDNKIVKNVNELLEENSTKGAFREAIKELKYQKSSRGQFCISFVLSFLLGVMIAINKDTNTIIVSVAEIFNGIDIAFIAMIIGAYSIFQALLSDEFVLALIKTENNLLKVSNKTFLNLILLYLSAIILNSIILILGLLVDEDWVLFRNMYLNVILAAIACIIYLMYNFLLIFEIKNFGKNLYKMFNASNSSRIVDLLDKKE